MCYQQCALLNRLHHLILKSLNKYRKASCHKGTADVLVLLSDFSLFQWNTETLQRINTPNNPPTTLPFPCPHLKNIWKCNLLNHRLRNGFSLNTALLDGARQLHFHFQSPWGLLTNQYNPIKAAHGAAAYRILSRLQVSFYCFLPGC